MKCSNCGTELEQGAKFCKLCGQSVESSAMEGNIQEASAQGQGNVSQGYENTSQGRGAAGQQDIAASMIAVGEQSSNGKKKGRTGLKVAVGAAAVIVAGAVAFAAPKLYQKIKATNMSPTEYYQYVEKKNRDEGLSGAMDYYDQALNSVWNENGYNKNINMKVSVSDTAKSMLSMTGLDFTNLADIELDETISMQENEMAIQMVVNANSDRLISYNMYCDNENKKFYVQVPEMSEGYVDLSDTMQEAKEEMEEAGAVGIPTNRIFSAINLSDILKMYPKSSDIKAIYNRYTDLYLDSVKDVQKAGGAYTAEGVTQEANQYKVILNGGELSELSKKLFTELKKDENVKAIIENVDKEAYTTFQESLEELEADSGMDGMTVTMDTYIAENEKIIGRTFALSDDVSSLEISYLCPTDGENFGEEFTVNLDGEELVRLTGSGTVKNGKISGDFVLGVGGILAEQASLADSSSVLKITLEDYDCSKISEGSVSGTMVLSTGAVAQLANCSLKYDFTTVKNDGSGTLSLLMGQNEMVTVDMKVKEAEKLTDMAPKDGDKVYNFSDDKDVEEYSKDLDEDKLVEDILEKIGIDTSGLVGLLGQLYGDAFLDGLAS